MKYNFEPHSDILMHSTKLLFFNGKTQTNAVVQPKLTVGASNDAHEREADQTADRVMRKSECTPMASMTPIAPIQRKCDHCEKEEKVNRKETGVSGGFTAPPSVSRAISRSGQALEPAAKTFMESRFNRKFDGVQVHTDGEAANSARDISAKAYTSGNHIVFGEGQYQPNTEGGRHLLAHELTHVTQQGGAGERIQRQTKSSKCSDAEVTALNLEMHTFCNRDRRCNPQTDTCATATVKVANGNACVRARTELQQKCFSPGDEGYQNHMQEIATVSATLRNCILVMTSKCAQDAAKVGVAVGAGYLLYRAIRMIPSLAPPLWWTIPGNLAVP